MAGYVEALPFTLAYEGGFVHHPDDRGGATNRGVTQEVYDAWRTDHDLPVRSVRDIEDHEVEALYFERYWLAGKCDALPWPASRVHFDACVHHGIVGAAKLLQRAVGVDDDGKIGPMTLAAVGDHPSEYLAGDMLDERLLYMARIVKARPSQSVFIEGWIKRCIELRKSVS